MKITVSICHITLAILFTIHIVCPAIYRRIVIKTNVDEHLKQIYVGIETRYNYIHFIEIDVDHVHFLFKLQQIIWLLKS